jgi:hypothetical protein
LSGVRIDVRENVGTFCGKAETGATGVSLTPPNYVKSIFVLFQKFFRASPTYASFSPLFIRLFAGLVRKPLFLVLSFPQHHNSGGAVSL